MNLWGDRVVFGWCYSSEAFMGAAAAILYHMELFGLNCLSGEGRWSFGGCVAHQLFGLILYQKSYGHRIDQGHVLFL